MNNNVETNIANAIIQVMGGKNGPIIAGILGIVGLVGTYYVVNENYKLAGTVGNKGFSLEPANSVKQDEIVVDADAKMVEEHVEDGENEN